MTKSCASPKRSTRRSTSSSARKSMRSSAISRPTASRSMRSACRQAPMRSSKRSWSWASARAMKSSCRRTHSSQPRASSHASERRPCSSTSILPITTSILHRSGLRRGPRPSCRCICTGRWPTWIGWTSASRSSKTPRRRSARNSTAAARDHSARSAASRFFRRRTSAPLAMPEH